MSLISRKTTWCLPLLVNMNYDCSEGSEGAFYVLLIENKMETGVQHVTLSSPF